MKHINVTLDLKSIEQMDRFHEATGLEFEELAVSLNAVSEQVGDAAMGEVVITALKEIGLPIRNFFRYVKMEALSMCEDDEERKAVAAMGIEELMEILDTPTTEADVIPPPEELASKSGQP